MSWTPPRWFRVLEACYFLFYPTCMLAATVYYVAIGDGRGVAVCSAWTVLMFLMIPLLMGESMRETLERWGVPTRVVRLYAETRFPGFLSIAFWVVLLATMRKAS